jgi:hypothetical protein
MKTPLMTVLAVGLLLATGPTRADEEADAKALLNKAMKAMGGQAKLAKLSTCSVKGRLTGSPDGEEIAVDFDGVWQGKDQYRTDLQVQVGGNNFKGALVINGDKGWLKKGDNTEDAPDGVAAFIQNIFYAGRMPQLLPAFTDKAYKLTLSGEVQVNGQPALGLSISHNDRKDVSLFFDKDKGLPIKSEIRLADPRGKEITVEFHYSDYKDYGGVKLCSKIALKLDDKDFALEFSELKAADKVDDGQFDRP